MASTSRPQVLFQCFLPALYLSRLTPTLVGVPVAEYAIIPTFAAAHIAIGALFGFAASRLLRLRGCAARRLELACGVHNCTSLPVLLLASLLAPEEAIRGVGLLSLYMLFWSPCLWTVGMFHLSNWDLGSVSQAANGGEKGTGGGKGGRLAAVRGIFKATLNPPLNAALLAVIIARVPPLAALFIGEAAPLRFVKGAVDSLAEGAVPLSASVLAWTLAKQGDGKGEGEGDSATTSEDGSRDRAAMFAAAVVRLLLAPACGLLLFRAAEGAGLLPLHDVPFRLLLLLQSAMPSAQNLSTMALLNKNTEPSAKPLAGLMALQYTIAPLPVTFWVAIFLREALKHTI